MDITEELYQSFSNVNTENVDNVISDRNNKELQFDQTVSVLVPKVRNRILVDVKSVQKIHELCEAARKEKFPFAELFLGVSTLFLGAFLGALISQVPYVFTFIGIFSYSICPIAGIGFGVAYIFSRKSNGIDNKMFAEKISEYLEDSFIVEGEE